jgi:enoyl-[acyl-carrier-protein] reductase (NADH)
VQVNPLSNPDALIIKDSKKYVADIKIITNPDKLVRRISDSAGQAEYCVVKMDYENTQSLHTIASRVAKAMEQSPTIKGVIILDNEGNVFYSTF